jgi:hypothetical protein
MPKYRKKPVTIEAVQWLGQDIYLDEVQNSILIDGVRDDIIVIDHYALYIHTLEGTMSASIGDYVIRGIHNELYPVKPDIFEATYEKAD